MQNDTFSPELQAILENIDKICAKYDPSYWRNCDSRAQFPQAFFEDMVQAGLLGIMMPPEYGGAGLSMLDAAMIVQRIVQSGAGMTGATTMHSYIFAPNPLLKHGTGEQKRNRLIPLIEGQHRVCFAITEPDAGLDTSRLKTRATRQGDYYEVHGQKVWPTGALLANKLLLIARTTDQQDTKRPIDGLSLFYTDLDKETVKIKPIPKLGVSANASCELFIDGLKIPIEDRIGEEGKGFYYLLDGLNPERILVAAEAIGLGRLALERAVAYAKERIVFGRPIGMNQGIQHPLAVCWAELEAAQQVVIHAAKKYDEGKDAGAYANAAKYLGAEAGFKACTQAIMTHGGMGYAKEFDVERYLREVMVPRLAPISQQLVLCYLSEHVLGLPKSY